MEGDFRYFGACGHNTNVLYVYPLRSNSTLCGSCMSVADRIHKRLIDTATNEVSKDIKPKPVFRK